MKKKGFGSDTEKKQKMERNHLFYEPMVDIELKGHQIKSYGSTECTVYNGTRNYSLPNITQTTVLVSSTYVQHSRFINKLRLLLLFPKLNRKLSEEDNFINPNLKHSEMRFGRPEYGIMAVFILLHHVVNHEHRLNQ